jgi:hypothetical protein
MLHFANDYHGKGIRARLVCCNRGCRLQLSSRLNSTTALVARVELLLQPRDDRGLPCGLPAVLFRDWLPLRHRRRRSVASCQLRRLDRRKLRDCHLRIRLHRI